MPPKENGSHFTNDIVKNISFKMKFHLNDPIGDSLALDQVLYMPISHFLKQLWPVQVHGYIWYLTG